MIPARILVVEDERIIALTLGQMLEELGYTVVGSVVRGEAAIHTAKELQPELVLMDIHLEGIMDGVDAARQIFKQFRIPIVFLTAYAEEETLRRAQESIPFGYLVKPVPARELHATIQMALTRRTAEAEVERSEERLRLALDAAELGVWEWDAHTGRIATAGRFDTIFGDMPESVVKDWRSLLERVHPQDRDLLDQTVTASKSRDLPLNLEFRYLGPAEGVGWLELHGRFCADEAGKPSRLIAVVKDITERRRIEERLRYAGVVFETTAEAIFIMDRDRRIISINPAFTAITGHGLEEALGKDPEEFLHARRHGDQFYSQLADAPGSQWQGEIDCRRKNGELFPVLESVSTVQAPNGETTHYVVVFSDITAMRRAEARLHHLAHHDPLTGLPNRLLCEDRLDHGLERARRDKTRCALLFLDLDGFKNINDSLGHGAGDLLLRRVASRITSAMRASDTAARLGGDEFIVIAEQIAHAEDAAVLARKLLTVLSAPFQVAGEQLRASASIGIGIYPDDGADRQALLKAADAAMYSAKAQGRNRYCFYTKEISRRATERLGVEQGLRRALDTQEGLVIHYQPQVALGNGAITGIEALVRWKHSGGELIPPARFIPIAEESGLIEALDRWVLASACAEVGKSLQVGGSPLRLAVNASPRDLARADLPESVRSVLSQTGFPASLLEIEITESTLQEIEGSLDVVHALKGLGVRIAIDDFGTGYSSLSALKHLPIDRLKIDRSFVQDLPGDHGDTAIVGAVAGLSRTLGLNVTAEGIETRAQRDSLHKLGCEEGQGFLFSPPLPFPELKTLLAREGSLAV